MLVILLKYQFILEAGDVWNMMSKYQSQVSKIV